MGRAYTTRNLPPAGGLMPAVSSAPIRIHRSLRGKLLLYGVLPTVVVLVGIIFHFDYP